MFFSLPQTCVIINSRGLNYRFLFQLIEKNKVGSFDDFSLFFESCFLFSWYKDLSLKPLKIILTLIYDTPKSIRARYSSSL